MLTVTLATMFWIILFPSKLLALVLRRDPLQLRADPERTSYWLEIRTTRRLESFFSQRTATARPGSAADPAAGLSRPLLPLYLALARLAAPSRHRALREPARQPDREQSIPDEIYTLW